MRPHGWEPEAYLAVARRLAAVSSSPATSSPLAHAWIEADGAPLSDLHRVADQHRVLYDHRTLFAP